MILCSHILSEVEATCGRVIIIHEGLIVGDGTPAELTARLPAEIGRGSGSRARLPRPHRKDGSGVMGATGTVFWKEYRGFINTPLAYIFVVLTLAWLGMSYFFGKTPARVHLAPGEGSEPRSVLREPAPRLRDPRSGARDEALARRAQARDDRASDVVPGASRGRSCSGSSSPAGC